MDRNDARGAEEQRDDNLHNLFPNESPEDLELVRSYIYAVNTRLAEKQSEIYDALEDEFEREVEEQIELKRNNVVPMVILRKCHPFAHWANLPEMLRVFQDCLRTHQMVLQGEDGWLHGDIGPHNMLFYDGPEGVNGLLIGWEQASQVGDRGHPEPDRPQYPGQPPPTSIRDTRSLVAGAAAWIRSIAKPANQPSETAAEPSAPSTSSCSVPDAFSPS